MQTPRRLVSVLSKARRSRLAVSGATVAVLVLLAGGAGYASSASSPVSANAPLTVNTPAGCNATPKKGFARCFSVVRTPSDHTITPNASAPPSTALGPAEIQAAYRLPATGGATVAIVDASGDSAAEADLATFRSHYNLSACTTANGCFKKVDQRGGTSYPADDPGWALETALDLDAVSAACPDCKIMLVEADSAGFDDLGTAVNEAVALGAKYVSNSYGASQEGADETSLDHYYDHPGTVVTASSGDTGNQVSYPAMSNVVVAAGGTRLTRDSSTPRGWTESAWSSGGSGCSQYEAKPDYQSSINTGCAKRATADISADADPASGLATYSSLPQSDGRSGWFQVGGTSLSSPLLTAMYALAGPPASGSYPASYPYTDPNAAGDLNDVTTGQNGSCGDLLCNAGSGWDGPTGLGTPNGVAALAAGERGDIVGQITDADTGKPVADAKVVAGTNSTKTDVQGHYDIQARVGTYTVTASAYSYKSDTKSDVTVTAGQQSTTNIALTPLPHSVVTGKVVDSGHGWGMYAKITLDDYPGDPIYTDPVTGKYSVRLAGSTTYTAHVTPMYPAVRDTTGNDGYLPEDEQLTVGTTDMTQDFTLKADPAACSAPGYGRAATSEDFTAFAGTKASDGWSVAGSHNGWRFDNPGNRTAAGGGDDRSAVADSGTTTGQVNSSLTSPDVDLSGQSAPHLSFASAYYGAPGQDAEVRLSTDGGKNWTSVWHQSTTNAIGHVDVPLPQAANAKKVRVRFAYRGRSAWWWSVDNVLIGTPTCVAKAGALVVGTVTDHSTGGPVNGATVSAGAASGLSTTTGDPDRPGGFYFLFTPATDSGKLTASADGYATATTTTTLTPNGVTRVDWSLTPAGGN
jgi:hypothetical protein